MAAGIELFRSKDLLVRYCRAHGDRRSIACFVTFGSYTYDHSLERQGFGEDFLRDEALDAIHVLTRDNRWYQYPEMDAALTAIAHAAGRYPRILTYGSSMGGYAALRFANRLSAWAAIAISPQFSLDPRLVPFEKRWRADVAKIRFREQAFVAPSRQIIVYDPRFVPDAAHVLLFAAAGPAELVGIPHAGHPAGPILVETGLLKETIRSIVAERFDPVSIQQAVRERRKQSQHYVFMLARRARNRSLTTRIALLRRAAAISPESHILSELAILLDQCGSHEEAGPLHCKAIQKVPSNVHAQINYVRHLEAIGRLREAMATVSKEIAGHTGSVRLTLRLLQLRIAMRRLHVGWLCTLVGPVAKANDSVLHFKRIAKWFRR